MLVKFSTAVNCYTQLNLTKLDVLDDFEEIRVATAYKVDGETLASFPADLDAMEKVEIEYKTFQGWRRKTTGISTFEELPAQARSYVEYIEQEVGVPVKWIGTGPVCPSIPTVVMVGAVADIHPPQRREDMIVR